MARTVRTIVALARKYGLDPDAVIAVARGEGGLVNRQGDVGDLAGGGSYGPFQLYTQGALPKRYRGNPKAADAWAWSPAGIDYALRKMKESGAGGLTGPRAVETIIRKFERPANPDSSVRNALSRYGKMPLPKSQGGRGGSYTSPPASSYPTPSGQGAGAEEFQLNRQRQGQQALLDFVLDYTSTGEVSRNSVARLTGAVSRLGTVQPPPVVEKGPRATTSRRKDPVERGVADRVLAAAHTQVGKPYVFGSGPSTDSFDCSDLVQWAWGQVGVDIPRTTYEQMKVLPKVGWEGIQPGDLIYKNDGGHVVMYVGGGKVIAAPYTGTVVQYQPLSRFKGGNYHVRRVK